MSKLNVLYTDETPLTRAFQKHMTRHTSKKNVWRRFSSAILGVISFDLASEGWAVGADGNVGRPKVCIFAPTYHVENSWRQWSRAVHHKFRTPTLTLQANPGPSHIAVGLDGYPVTRQTITRDAQNSTRKPSPNIFLEVCLVICFWKALAKGVSTV